MRWRAERVRAERMCAVKAERVVRCVVGVVVVVVVGGEGEAVWV